MNKLARIISGIVGLAVIAGAVYIYNKNNTSPKETKEATATETTASTTTSESAEPAGLDEGGYNSSRSNKPSPVKQLNSTVETDATISGTTSIQSVQTN